MNRINEINQEIDQLKAQLQAVEGTPTEIYARIVGYYRSVKNWNKGKKEEYQLRKEFDTDFNIPQDKLQNCHPVNTVQEGNSTSKEASCLANKEGYLYFYRESCPNCPPVKNYLSGMKENVIEINVDTDEGLEMARHYEVLATPTVIYFDAQGEESFRANGVAELKKAVAIAS